MYDGIDAGRDAHVLHGKDRIENSERRPHACIVECSLGWGSSAIGQADLEASQSILG